MIPLSIKKKQFYLDIRKKRLDDAIRNFRQTHMQNMQIKESCDQELDFDFQNQTNFWKNKFVEEFIQFSNFNQAIKCLQEFADFLINRYQVIEDNNIVFHDSLFLQKFFTFAESKQWNCKELVILYSKIFTIIFCHISDQTILQQFKQSIINLLQKIIQIDNFEILKNTILCLILFNKKYDDDFWDIIFSIIDFQLFKTVFQKNYQKNYQHVQIFFDFFDTVIYENPIDYEKNQQEKSKLMELFDLQQFFFQLNIDDKQRIDVIQFFLEASSKNRDCLVYLLYNEQMKDQCFQILQDNKDTELVDIIFHAFMILFSLDDKKIPKQLIKNNCSSFIKIALKRITEISALQKTTIWKSIQNILLNKRFKSSVNQQFLIFEKIQQNLQAEQNTNTQREALYTLRCLLNKTKLNEKLKLLASHIEILDQISQLLILSEDDFIQIQCAYIILEVMNLDDFIDENFYEFGFKDYIVENNLMKGVYNITQKQSKEVQILIQCLQEKLDDNQDIQIKVSYSQS